MGLGNGGDGIRITTAPSALIKSNLVSANSGAGISMTGSDHIIIDNKIGTDITGNLALGNLVGVQSALNNLFSGWQIGTGNPGEGNIIAYSTNQAILFTDAGHTGNLISENSILAMAQVLTCQGLLI